MMALDQRQYGDPLEVLLRAEAETCRGCVHEKRVPCLGEIRKGAVCFGCKLKDHKYGTRCNQYEEKPL
jgi:hypothetical protein